MRTIFWVPSNDPYLESCPEFTAAMYRAWWEVVKHDYKHSLIQSAERQWFKKVKKLARKSDNDCRALLKEIAAWGNGRSSRASRMTLKDPIIFQPFADSGKRNHMQKAWLLTMTEDAIAQADHYQIEGLHIFKTKMIEFRKSLED